MINKTCQAFFQYSLINLQNVHSNTITNYLLPADLENDGARTKGEQTQPTYGFKAKLTSVAPAAISTY
jgi:hypothetical protein